MIWVRCIAASQFWNPPVRLGPRKNFFVKRRMRAGRCVPQWRNKQVRLSELEETCYAKLPNMFCFEFSGEHTRPACWRSRLAIANFSGSLPEPRIGAAKEDCSGETPKPARETRALPNPLRHLVSPNADRLFRRGGKVDISRWRSIAGSRASCRVSDAFRHSARSIARQRERDRFSGYRS